jgi:FAD/FMN-containing dehydrogenase
VVDVIEPAMQAAITDFRTSGLNIMMSMKQEGKPVSFVEDCAVPLPHLADYTERLNKVFESTARAAPCTPTPPKAACMCAPVLNLKLDKDVKAMRAIAEEAFAMVRDIRARIPANMATASSAPEFHAQMFGPQIVHASRR